MIRLRNSSCFKVMSFVLVCLFLFQFEGLLAQDREENPDLQFKNLYIQFNRAIDEYKGSDYQTAAARLARLKAAFENIDNPDNEMICKQGQTLLLLGACCEKLKDTDNAGENYMLAKKILGRGFNIKGLKLKGLPVYKKIKRSKIETGNNVICVPGKKPGWQGWMKKNKRLLLIGGTVVVVIVAYLLLKKKPKRTLTVNLGQGVVGSPESGTHTYKKGAVVTYNYSVQGGGTALSVKLDGIDVPARGTITMDTDHTLTATRQYTLTVTRGPGVDGTPDTGTYLYNAGDIVNYSYTLQPGYEKLVITLDDSTVNASGSITMNGDHTLSASSAKIDTPPVVSITTPDDGETVSGIIPVKAQVSDDNGVTMVEFYIDGDRVEKETVPPYRFIWDTTQYLNREYKIMVIAYDTAGNKGSREIEVIVSN